MKRLIIVALVIFSPSWAGAQTSLERQAFATLKPEAQKLVLTWLNTNCGAAEQMAFERKITTFGSVLELAFWEAFRLGPTEQEMNTVSAAVARRYDERQTWLRQLGDLQMGKAETARQLAISGKQYAERELLQYVERYKSAALAGLGLVGTQHIATELTRIADDDKNPAQTSAKEAIKGIRQKHSR
ncbi:MAG TPA: hypothetical protein PKD12_18035 [Nitrospira sp.]|nr:hypothetical protein [Nitrospira sp.]